MASSVLSDFRPANQLESTSFLIHEDLEHAYKLQIKAQEIQKSIDKALSDLEQELRPLRQEIQNLMEARDRIITEHVQGGCKQDGAFYLKETSKPKLVLDGDLFAEKYPEEFEMLWREIGTSKFKPSKSDAAKVLTSYQIEKCCKQQGEFKYTVDWDPHHKSIPEKGGDVEC